MVGALPGAHKAVAWAQRQRAAIVIPHAVAEVGAAERSQIAQCLLLQLAAGASDARPEGVLELAGFSPMCGTARQQVQHGMLQPQKPLSTWHSFDQQAVALPLHAEQVLPLFDEALEGVRLPLPLPGQVLGQALAAPQLAERQPAAAAQLLDALALQPPRGIPGL